MYYLEHQGSHWICFSKQKNREFKLKYFKRLFDNNNIVCLQEVHGKHEYLQALQVLAPWFRFFGTLIPENENAGGSAICIHRDLVPEEAIVTHLITCQGRDHLVNIQSGRHNFVFVNVYFVMSTSPNTANHEQNGYAKLYDDKYIFMTNVDNDNSDTTYTNMRNM